MKRKVFIPINMTVPEMEAIWDKVEWHCPGRHGVIRNIDPKESPRVASTIMYYFGGKPDKGQWWARNPENPKNLDVEFNHQCKVFPPPEHAWNWCGEAILSKFQDMKYVVETERKLKNIFKMGQAVSFVFKGQTKHGLVANKGPGRATVVVQDEGTWHVPYLELEIE